MKFVVSYRFCVVMCLGRPEIRGLPRFLFGQSMGGAIALKALLKRPNEWDGIVLVAPMCKVTSPFSLSLLSLISSHYNRICLLLD